MLKYKIGSSTYVYDDNRMLLLEENLYDDCKFNYGTVESCDNIIDNVKPNSITLNMINSCNLKCDYCYANEGTYGNENNIMNFDTARKSIMKIIEMMRINGNNFLKVLFFGGEPLLTFDMIKKIVNWCNETYKDIIFKFGVTTNGTLLTEEMINFFEKNDFGIAVSLDGDKEANDKHRKDKDGFGTYDKVIKNLNKIKNTENIAIRLTITKGNIEINKYIESLLQNTSIKKFTYAFDFASMDKIEINKFNENYNKLFQKYKQDIIDGNLYDITNITNVIHRLIYRNRMLKFCNAGKGYFSVASDGEIYLCHRFLENSLYNISNIDKGYKISKNKENYNNLVQDYTSCKGCEVRYSCGGPCYNDRLLINEKEKNKNLVCLERKFNIENSFRLLLELPEESRIRFAKYILSSKNNG